MSSLIFNKQKKKMSESMMLSFLQFLNSLDWGYPGEETIGLKCQSQFSGKNKKNIINMSSAEFAQRVAKVKFSRKMTNN